MDDAKASLQRSELPTELINRLYHNRVKDPLSWDVLVASYASIGFWVWTGLCYQQPDSMKYKQRETAMKVRSESFIQQKDGKCKACRGFKWAVTMDVRDIGEAQEVPCKSQHKSYVPYTVGLAF